MPEDRGGSLGRDHAVDRVLQHDYRIGARKRYRTPRAALADDDRDERHAETQTTIRGACDRLRLSALLGIDARIGARSIDKADHRQSEALRRLHQPHGFAVAFRTGHAEIVLE